MRGGGRAEKVGLRAGGKFFLLSVLNGPKIALMGSLQISTESARGIKLCMQ